MKQFYTSALAILLGASMALAEQITYTDDQGAIYTLDTDTKTATLSDVPSEAQVTDLMVPDDISHDGTTYPVVAVGEKAAMRAASTLITATFGANVESIGANAFYGASSLASITLPESLKSINEYAFYNCRVLRGVELPVNLETIGNFAFYNCYAITDVNLPAAVSHIGANPWGGCTGLQAIEVDMTNPDYTAIDNVLFTKDGATLVSYPIGRQVTEYAVPASCKIIGSNSMRNNKYLNRITLPEGLEEIQAGAFNVCNLLEVTIPASVKSIGERVFTSNPYIVEYKVAEGNTEYAAIDKYLCTKDGKTLIQGVPSSVITIPASVDSIAPYAFYNMSQIRVLYLNNVRTIGATAFYNASQLIEIDWGTKLETISKQAFQGCVSLTSITFPSTLRHITNDQAFARCTRLREVQFNEGIEEIGTSTFILCSSIENIYIPGSVTTWGDAPFTNCPSLRTATFGDGITYIPSSCLSYASSLESVVLPSSLKEIGSFAFGFCEKLTDVELPENLEVIGSAAFEFVPFDQLVLPDNVTRIEDNAFGYCYMNSVTLNDNLKYIGPWAFGTNNFTEVIIPEGVEEIGLGAFGYCNDLQSIVLPSTVTKLGEGVATGCPVITDFTNNSLVPQQIESAPIDNDRLDKCKLHVPDSALDAYRNAPIWRDFGSILSGIEEISADEASEITEIYTVDGRKLTHLQSGINIVVLSNGKTRKILR